MRNQWVPTINEAKVELLQAEREAGRKAYEAARAKKDIRTSNLHRYALAALSILSLVLVVVSDGVLGRVGFLMLGTGQLLMMMYHTKLVAWLSENQMPVSAAPKQNKLMTICGVLIIAGTALIFATNF